MLKVDLRRLEELTGVVSESVPGGGELFNPLDHFDSEITFMLVLSEFET